MTLKGGKRGRVWHYSCNIFLATNEPSLSKSISADSPSNRHTHSTHTSTSWAELCWRAGVLAQAIEVTLIEPQKCQVKMGDWTSCKSCKSLLCIISHVQVTKVATATAQHVTKPCHQLLRKHICPCSLKTQGTVLFHIYSELDFSMAI